MIAKKQPFSSHSHVVRLIFLAPFLLLFAILRQQCCCNNAQVVLHHDLAQRFERRLQQWSHNKQQRLNYLKTTRPSFDQQIYDAWEPEWDCEVQERIGRRFGDGGKFVCGFNATVNAEADCLVYSIGSNYDASFEQDVRSRSACEIHTFDPTINLTRMDGVAREHNLHVHGIGLGHTHATFKSGKVEPLSAIMTSLGHTNKALTLLKVDCEGCEYDAFEQIFAECAAGKLAIRQLQVELHIKDYRTDPPYQPFNFSRIEQFFAGADSCGLMIFHKERNNWGCDGYRCVEYSFISKAAAWSAFKASHQ